MPTASERSKVRLLPDYIEGEQSVLGAMIVSDTCAATAEAFLAADDFARPNHQMIFKLICHCYTKHEKCDPILLGEVAKAKKLDLDMEYLMSLFSESIPWTCDKIEEYARIIKDRSLRRQVLKMVEKQSAALYNEDTPATDTVSRMMSDCSEIIGNGNDRRIQTFKEIASAVYDNAGIAAACGKDFIGLPTGLWRWDRTLRGLKPQTVTFIAARPGMGKTSLMMQMVRSLAKASVASGVFSLEMSAAQLAQRMVSAITGLDNDAVETGKLKNDGQWKQLLDATADMSEYPLYICDDGGMTIPEIMGRGRQMIAKHKVQVIFVDHVGEIKGESRRGRYDEVSENVEGLKRIAKALEIPVVALCQLNRGIEGRKNEDRKPKLSDLRETGRIEEVAESVTFIWDPTPKPAENEFDEPIPLELLIGKNRNGRMSKVSVMFNEKRFTFNEIETDRQGPHPATHEPKDGGG